MKKDALKITEVSSAQKLRDIQGYLIFLVSMIINDDIFKLFLEVKTHYLKTYHLELFQPLDRTQRLFIIQLMKE